MFQEKGNIRNINFSSVEKKTTSYKLERKKLYGETEEPPVH